MTKEAEAETLYPKQIAGAPGRTRTRDTRFRKPLLYPPELQAHERDDYSNSQAGRPLFLKIE